MKLCDIDFSEKNTIREILRMSVWRWLFVLFSLGSAGYMGKVVVQDNLENTEEKIALSKARKQNFHRPTIPPHKPILEQQANAINLAIDGLNLPWSDLFDAIEAATPPNIALLYIEPDTKKYFIKIQAEAATSNAMIAYVEKLKRQPVFSNVFISKHEIYEPDPQKPLRFSIEVSWNKGEL